MKKNTRKLSRYRISTLAIHAGEGNDETVRPVSPPIYQSNAFSFSSSDEGGEAFAVKYGQYIYTRLGNPTIRSLEEKVAVLEGAQASLAAASGMGAISSAIFGLAGGATHIVCFSTVYGGTFRLLRDALVPFGIETTFLTPGQQDGIEDRIRDNTRLLYLESPMNPSMELLDVERITAIAKRRGIKTLFDNTFATPSCQNPLEMGVDLVLHSASKYLCGHGDALGGIISGSEELVSGIRDKVMVGFGGVMSPFNAWLILRGIQTLPLRMQRHCENAQNLAEFLEKHPRVEKVNYPGLSSFPQAELAKKQMSGFGGVLSFEIAGAYDAARSFLDHLELCTISGSLGDSKTLAIHPASMSHRGFTRETREKTGVTDGLIRIATGLEDSGDIIEDIDRALSAAL